MNKDNKFSFDEELTEEGIKDILKDMELEELQVNKFNYIAKLKKLHGNVTLHSIGQQSYIKPLSDFEFSIWRNQDQENCLSFGGAEYLENSWLYIKEDDVFDVYGEIDDTDNNNITCDVTIVLKSKNELRLQIA